MGKSVMKRCIAAALAVAMIFTSADWSMAITSRAANTVTITDAELVAKNGIGLTDEEKAILNSGLIDSVSHTVTVPEDSDLAAVDSENTVVYAKKFEDNGYVWIPETATISADGVDTDVTFKSGEVKYEGIAYDSSVDFECSSNDYSVAVAYKLYIDVDVNEQEELSNIPFYLADAMNNMEVMKSVSLSWNEVWKQIVTSDAISQLMEGIALGSGTLTLSDTTKKYVEKWIADYKNDPEQSELTKFIDAHNKAEKHVVDMLESGEVYKACAEQVYDGLSELLKSKSLITSYAGVLGEDPEKIEEMFEMVSNIPEKLEPAATSNWDVLTVNTISNPILVDDLTSYGEFDTVVKNAIGKSSAYDVADGTLTKNILAAETAILCNVNRYNVKVVVKAEVIDKAGNKKVLTADKTLNLASGLSEEEVIAEIKADGIEADSLAAWNALDEGVAGGYAINTENYDRDVKTDVNAPLDNDATYTISYSPKALKVTYVENGEEADFVDTVYGGIITFPKSGNSEQTYEYTVDGVVHEEGEAYRVTENLEITRKLGKAKRTLRVYDLVVADYKDELSDLEEAILLNLAVNSKFVSVRDIERDLLVLSDDGKTVTAKSYDAGNGMKWEPAAVYVMNGSEVVQIITSFDENGTATITATDYTKVEADYVLVIDITDDEVNEALNLPRVLVDEAKSQLADLATLASYEGDLDQVKFGQLDLASPKLGPAAQAAIKELEACFTGNDLTLSLYIDEYKKCTTDVDRLDFYYSNKMYENIRKEIALVAAYLDPIITDPALPDVMESVGFGGYVEKLETASENIAGLTKQFITMNDKINTNSGAYEALLALLLSKGEVNNHQSSDGLKSEDSLSQVSKTEAFATVIINVLDGNGTKVLSDKKEEPFKKTDGMTADDIAAYEKFIADFETANVDKEHYSVEVQGELPKAGEALKGNVEVVYTWTPNTYTVRIEGEADQTFTYDNRLITLPASQTAGVKYIYTVGANTHEVTSEAKTIRLNEEEFAALFGSAKVAVIEREEIDVAKENALKFVASVNSALSAKGTTSAASLVAFENAEGKLSVVLRMNPVNGGIKTALTEVVMVLTESKEITFGDGVLKDTNGIHVDTVVSELLDSQIGTQLILSLIDTNGEIKENVKDKVKDQTVVVDALSGVADTENLGGLLMETTLGVSGVEMPLYISLQDYNQNASQLATLRKAVNASAEYADIILSDGRVNATLTAPEKAHELYLAAMMVEGEIDIHNFQTPSLVEMVDYARALDVEAVVIEDEAVTADTLLNTVKQLSASTDLSNYKDTLATVLKLTRALLDGSMDNAEITEVNDASTPHNEYNLEAFCPSAKLVGALGLSESYADFIVGDIEVPVRAVLKNCDTEYTALVVDVNAEGIQNKVDLTKATELTAANDNTVIVLFDTISRLTANGKTFIDLNGNTVEILTANAGVHVLDSKLDTAGAGTIGTIEAIISPSNVSITAGNYNYDVTGMLPKGYIQKNGAVSNRYYTLSDDGNGNITLNVFADFMKLPTDGLEWKKIAMEMAVDAALNAYTWGAVTVEGNEIYRFDDFTDLIAEFNSVRANGVRSEAGKLVEEISEEGITKFANRLIEDITNFAEVANRIRGEEAIATYDLTTEAWDIKVRKADGKDYITASLGTDKARTRTITLKVVDDNAGLADFVEELGNVFGVPTIDVALNELSYGSEGFNYDVSASADVTADLTKDKYPALIGIILAYNMADGAKKDEMVDAVNAYLENGEVEALVALIENTPAKELIAAAKKANAVDFATIIDALDKLTGAVSESERLFDLYDDALNICCVIANRLEITGGNQKLVSRKTGFGTYEVSRGNVKLTLKLATNETAVEPPVISAPTVTNGGNIFNSHVDEENLLIYLDVAATGLDQEEFLEAVKFEITEDCTVKQEFGHASNCLVQNGETIVVEAENDSGITAVEYTVIILGDVQTLENGLGDGLIEPNDATVILKNTVGSKELSIIATYAAGINNTEGVDPGDATIVLKKVVGGISYNTWLK